MKTLKKDQKESLKRSLKEKKKYAGKPIKK